MLVGPGQRLTPFPPPLFTVRIPIKGGGSVGDSLRVGGKGARANSCSHLKPTQEGGLTMNWERDRGVALGMASPSPTPTGGPAGVPNK